jgi:hypothetical protein
VLVAAGVVFVVGLIGNILSFGSRFTNALVTAIVFAIIFGVLAFLAFREGASPTLAMPADFAWLEPVLVAAAVVFVVDLIGNMLSFNNRFVNAIVTSVVFAAVFGALAFFAYKEGAIPTVTQEVPAAEQPK